MKRRELLLATPLLCVSPRLFAQSYPSRPIRYIVGVSFNSGWRVFPVTASGRTRPER